MNLLQVQEQMQCYILTEYNKIVILIIDTDNSDLWKDTTMLYLMPYDFIVNSNDISNLGKYWILGFVEWLTESCQNKIGFQSWKLFEIK